MAYGLLGGYLALYRGLESGHVGLVSAISASYAGVAVLLSVLVLGEHLTGVAAGGVVLTVTGVTLASSRAGRASPGARETARATGVVFGLAAALCYGVGGFLLGRYTRQFGWLVPVVVGHVGAMAVLLALLATPLRRAEVSQRRLGVALGGGGRAGRRGRGGLLRPGRPRSGSSRSRPPPPAPTRSSR